MRLAGFASEIRPEALTYSASLLSILLSILFSMPLFFSLSVSFSVLFAGGVFIVFRRFRTDCWYSAFQGRFSSLSFGTRTPRVWPLTALPRPPRRPRRLRCRRFFPLPNILSGSKFFSITAFIPFLSTLPTGTAVELSEPRHIR